MSNVSPLRGAPGAQSKPAASADSWVVAWVKDHRGAIACVVLAAVGLYLWQRFDRSKSGEGGA